MNYFSKKLLLAGISLVCIAMLSACGGSGDSTADVITVMKVLTIDGRFVSATEATQEVALMVNATGVKVLGIKCVSLKNVIFPGFPGNIATEVAGAILVDMSSADADKAKPFGFSTFGTAEAASYNALVVPCS